MAKAEAEERELDLKSELTKRLTEEVTTLQARHEATLKHAIEIKEDAFVTVPRAQTRGLAAKRQARGGKHVAAAKRSAPYVLLSASL